MYVDVAQIYSHLLVSVFYLVLQCVRQQLRYAMITTKVLLINVIFCVALHRYANAADFAHLDH